MTVTQHNDDVSGIKMVASILGALAFLCFAAWGSANVASGCGNRGGECVMVPWVTVDQPQ